MKHFETRRAAQKYADTQNVFTKHVQVAKKKVGQANRIKRPFMVGSYMEILNF